MVNHKTSPTMPRRITLTDDGTMDTVLICQCGQEFRFNPDGADLERDDTGAYKVGNRRYRSEEQAAQAAYDLFVAEAIEEVESEHVCGEGE